MDNSAFVQDRDIFCRAITRNVGQLASMWYETGHLNMYT